MIARWLGLYLLTIAALTLFPFAAPACGRSGWTLALLPGDFLLNMLMFVPVGFAVRRTSLARTAALGLLLSFMIEFSQQWLPRNPDFTDLASNTLGAIAGRSLAGAWIARFGEPSLSRVTERFAVRAAAVLLLAATLGAVVFSPDNGFSNWESRPLMIGNQTTGDRAWAGDLLELAIYDRALGAPAPGAPPAWKDGGPILRLDLAGTATARLDGPEGETRVPVRVGEPPRVVKTASSLRFAPTGLTLDPRIGSHLLERLGATNQLTLDARIRPQSVRLQGPATILSFGDGTSANLLLAQHAGTLRARIRTTGTDPLGTDPQLESRWNALSGGEQHVRVTYDGHDALMFVDGECAAENSLSVAAAPPLIGAALGGTLVACCALASLAFGSFHEQRRARLTRGLGGGALTWCLLYAFGTWHHVQSFDGAAACLGLLSLATTVPMLIADRLTARSEPGEVETKGPAR